MSKPKDVDHVDIAIGLMDLGMGGREALDGERERGKREKGDYKENSKIFRVLLVSLKSSKRNETSIALSFNGVKVARFEFS